MKGFAKNKKFFFFLILGIFLIFFQALALELSWPSSPVSGISLSETTSLPYLVKYFYEWGIALGGLAAFIALLIAGFQYLTSAGNVKAMQEARDKIVSAFLGLLILLGSYLILNTINPQLTTLRMPPGFSSGLTNLECDTDADCQRIYNQPGYKCTDESPGDGTSTGVCKLEERRNVTCTGAYIFEGKNYTGRSRWIGVGETIEDVSPESVMAYAEIDGQEKACCCSDEELCEARERGYENCGCYLQVFAGKKFLGIWKTCGDLEAVVSGCEKNIVDYTDKPIYCVKLIKASW